MTSPSYVAKPILEIDGSQASSKLFEDILQISVEESLHLPAMFTIIINNPYLSGRESTEPAWQHQKLFEIGKTIKIGFSAGTTEEFPDQNQDEIIEGEITAMESHFTSGSQAPIIIRGYDYSHRLHRGRYNRSFQNMSDSDIVKAIAGEVGLALGTVDDSGGPYGYGDIGGSNGYVFQENQTNMEFLKARAARHGFEFFVQDGKLNFRKPKVNSSVKLEWLKDLQSFRVRVSSAQQVNAVEVRGWDYSQKKPIIETASSETVHTETQHGKGSKKSQAFKGKPPTPKMVVVNQPVSNPSEAKKIAQGIVDELGGEFVHADGRAIGNPQIRPGNVVELQGLGKYSGKYYVTETRHLYDGRVYTTEFSVRGLRTGDLLSTLSPATRLQAGQTPVVGVVTNNKDPKGWGRVRVKFPTLTEDHESYWARVVATGAGHQRGFDCIPEVNDEVLVAFEHGDIHRPYIIGNVWNGTDNTPEKVDESVVSGKVRLRTFKTRIGHKLQFVDEDKGNSKKGFYVDTVYGHNLRMNDSDKFAEVKTKNGHFVKLDDQSKNVEIKTSGGLYVKLDDAGKSIEIKSGGATITMKQSTGEVNIKAGTKLTIDAAQVDISASAVLSLKGAMIKLN